MWAMEASEAEPKARMKPHYVAAFVVLGVITLIGFASPFLPPEWVEGLGPWLNAVRETPWAPLAAILAYVAFASLGAPQIVLITALVAAFGPWAGFAYSWTGKMIACALGFVVGRRFGAAIVARHASPGVSEFMRQLGRRGFLVSALIRMVPTVPSVLVNIAAGATPIRFSDFLLGTALGSVPKMALLAFGGHAAMEAMRNHSVWAWVGVAAVVALWVIVSVVARRWMRAVKEREAREGSL
jgi:uncharacterized membrane protein YdjX (TVP38/TMEM64 family)